MAVIEAKEYEKIWIFTVSGPLGYDELVQCIKEFYPRITSHVIWDLTGGSINAVSIEQLKQLTAVARQYAANRQSGKTAYVASDNSNFGIFRMYIAYAEIAGLPFQYSVFRTFQESLDWVLN